MDEERTPVDTMHDRAAKAISADDVESCYDSELVRSIAIAICTPDGKAEFTAIIKRFQSKYKRDFSTTRLKQLVEAETFRVKVQSKPRAPVKEWESKLIRRAKSDEEFGEESGAILTVEANAISYLQNHPAWQGVLGFDELREEHAILGMPPPRSISVGPGGRMQDHHDTELTSWFQEETKQPWRVETVRRAFDKVARENTFHPVRQYLESLAPWDGRERLPTFLQQYCGVGKAEGDDTPPDEVDEYVAACGERWMISAIARAYKPGVQVDHVLILEGGEGLGKSSIVEILGGGGQFSGTLTVSLEGKPAQELVAAGVWIWELAEMAAVKNTKHMEHVKDFVSKRKEIFRPAYGRRVVHYERQCVFLATVNGDDYLDQSDGKRRWWPVRCMRPFDVDGLKDVVEKLWAEALFKFRRGDIWHFDPIKDRQLIATAKLEQEARVPDDANANAYLSAARTCVQASRGPMRGSASIEEILTQMKISSEKRNSVAGQCGRVLKAAGWTKQRPRAEKGQVSRYYPPDGRSK